MAPLLRQLVGVELPSGVTGVSAAPHDHESAAGRVDEVTATASRSERRLLALASSPVQPGGLGGVDGGQEQVEVVGASEPVRQHPCGAAIEHRHVAHRRVAHGPERNADARFAA